MVQIVNLCDFLYLRRQTMGELYVYEKYLFVLSLAYSLKAKLKDTLVKLHHNPVLPV
jgi:hypothetical protein